MLQNCSLSPNWMIRGAWALWICPKNGLDTSILGGLNRTWLKALKNSPRNCNCLLSVSRNFLNTEMSQFQKPGAEIRSRPEVPKVSGAVREKALGLNQ